MVHYWDEPSLSLNDHRRQLWSLLAANNKSYFCLELLNEAQFFVTSYHCLAALNDSVHWVN